MDPTLLRLLFGSSHLPIACLLAAFWFIDRSANWSRQWAVFHAAYAMSIMLGDTGSSVLGDAGSSWHVHVLSSAMIGTALVSFFTGTLAFDGRTVPLWIAAGVASVIAGYCIAFVPETGSILPLLLIPSYLIGAAFILRTPGLVPRVAGAVLILRTITNVASRYALETHQPIEAVLLATLVVNHIVSLSLVVAAVIESRNSLLKTQRDLLGANEQLTGLMRRIEEQSHDYSRARDRANAANQAKSLFLANMSHELRTPLNAVIGYSELIHLTQPAAQSGRIHDYIGNIIDAGRHLLKIVDEVLEISRTDLGAIEIEPTALSVAELVDGVVRMVALGADGKRQLIQRKLEPDLAMLAEHRLIHQALLNVVANAVKFTPTGGRIVISARRHGAASIELSVTDSGPGIPPEMREQVFDRFWQRADVLTREHQGVGLGLSIARRFVELNGGSITIEDADGGGARFVILLPAA